MIRRKRKRGKVHKNLSFFLYISMKMPKIILLFFEFFVIITVSDRQGADQKYSCTKMHNHKGEIV